MPFCVCWVLNFMAECSRQGWVHDGLCEGEGVFVIHFPNLKTKILEHSLRTCERVRGTMLGCCLVILSLHWIVCGKWMLRCQAQLELTLMTCLSDRSTFWRALWPFYFFGALCDCSTFASTDARATDLGHGFCCEGLVVVKEVLSLALCVYLLLEMSWPSSSSRSSSIKQKLVLQLHMLQQQPECVLQELKLSLPPISTVCTATAVLGSVEEWRDSSNDRV
jgi:hypothetical protein